MFSFIINLHNSLRDWQMVEPFFYHIQARDQFKIFSQINNITGVNDMLAKTVHHYLEQHNIRDWQVVFVLDMIAPVHEKRFTLGAQLKIVKERFIQQISNRGFPPAHVWVIAVDSGLANDNEPSNPMEGRIAWELDCFGYLRKSLTADEESLYFTDGECSLLDQSWGDLVNLNRAGLLQQPDPEFLTELQDRSQKVISAVDTIIENKINLYQENSGVNPTWEVIPEDSLREIRIEFKETLTKMLKPPLSNRLDIFYPSSILKDILKKRVGLAGSITGIRLLRLQVELRSNYERNRALIKLAVLILFIHSSVNNFKSAVQGRIVEGNIYQVDMQLNSSFDTFLNEYLLFLGEAEKRIETRLMHVEKVILPWFEERGDYTSPLSRSIEENAVKVSISKIRNPADFSLWDNYLGQVAHYLQRTGEEVLDSTWEDAQALNQTQKLGTPEAEIEIFRVDDYREDLDKQRSNLKNKLSAGRILFSDPVDEWIRYQRKSLSGFQYLLESRPGYSVMAVCMAMSLLVILSAFVPKLYGMDWASNWIKLFIALLIIITGLLGITLLSKRKVFRPISDMVSKTQDKADELMRRQKEMAFKCKDYLNHIYHMFRLNQTSAAANEKLQALSRETLLLRYHRKQINHQKDLLESLLRSAAAQGEDLYWDIGSRVSDMKNLGLLIEQKFNLNEDIYHSPLYSPVAIRMLLYPELSNQQVKVKIGGVEEDVQMKPFKNDELHITFERDQVYTI